MLEQLLDLHPRPSERGGVQCFVNGTRIQNIRIGRTGGTCCSSMEVDEYRLLRVPTLPIFFCRFAASVVSCGDINVLFLSRAAVVAVSCLVGENTIGPFSFRN